MEPKNSGSLLSIHDWQLSADAKYLLVQTDYRKVRNGYNLVQLSSKTLFAESNGAILVLGIITYII